MNYVPDYEITNCYLIFSANNALLGEIRPNMRRIAVEYLKSQRKILLYFFYDSPPSQDDLDYDVEGTISAEMSAFFPDEMQFEEKSLVILCPNRLPNLGISVYSRYEPSSSEDLVK